MGREHLIIRERNRMLYWQKESRRWAWEPLALCGLVDCYSQNGCYRCPMASAPNCGQEGRKLAKKHWFPRLP